MMADLMLGRKPDIDVSELKCRAARFTGSADGQTTSTFVNATAGFVARLTASRAQLARGV